MTKLRGYIPTMFMLATLMFGATAANAGIIMGGRASADSNTCETNESSILTELVSSAVTLATTGIIMGGRFGIIMGGRTESQEACTTDTLARTGIIMGG